MSNKATGESRYWHYRTNNLSEEHYIKLTQVPCEWMFIGAVEVGELAKGEHYHAVFKFSKSIRDGSARKFMCASNETLLNRNKTWYLDVKRVNSEITDFIKYVYKSDLNNLRHGNPELIEAFESLAEQRKTREQENRERAERKIIKAAEKETHADKQQRKNDLEETRHFHAARGDIEWFQENDTKYLTSAEFQRKLVWAQPDNKKLLRIIDNYYIFGEPGLGKSAMIRFIFGKYLYEKRMDRKEWDSFFNLRQDCQMVLIDECNDVDSWEYLGGVEGMKRNADVYPFTVRQLYGNRQLYINPQKWFITSNYTLSQVIARPNKYGRTVPNVEVELKALNRRYKQMHASEFAKKHKVWFDKRIVPNGRVRWENDTDEIDLDEWERRYENHDYDKGPFVPFDEVIVEQEVINKPKHMRKQKRITV